MARVVEMKRADPANPHRGSKMTFAKLHVAVKGETAPPAEEDGEPIDVTEEDLGEDKPKSKPRGKKK